MLTFLRPFLVLLLALPAVAVAQTWEEGPPMPTARADAAVAVLNGSLYVIGGQSTTGDPLGVVERFVPSENEWVEDVAPLRDARYAAAASVLNGQIILAGGIDDGGEATEDVEVYVPGEDDWESFPSLEQERSGLAAVVLGGHLFVLGGASEGGAFLPSCEAFDADEEEWYPYSPWTLSPGRASFGAAVAGGAAYLAGGFSQFGPLDRVERYTLGDGSVPLAPLSSPRGGLALAATGPVFGGDLFAVGGRDPDNDVLATVERYDIDRDAWEAAPPLPTARAGAVAAYLDGTLYVVGGRDAFGNALATVEVFEMPTDDEDEATPSAFALDAAYPNPFADRTALTFRVARPGPVTLTVYDVRGRAVATLADRVVTAGEHRVRWDGTSDDGRRLPAGVYVARLLGPDGHAAIKLTLLRR